MKKFLLTLLTVAASVGIANADSAVFTFDGYSTATSVSVADVAITLPNDGNGDITMTFSKNNGQNDPKFYKNDKGVRFYGGNAVTFEAKNGASIQKIVFTTSTKKFVANTTVPEVGTLNITEQTATWTPADGSEGETTIKVAHGTSSSTAQAIVQTVSVTYSYGGKVKTDPQLSFSEKTVTINLGASDYTLPTLSNPHNLSVKYASDAPTIATVDETSGELTIKKDGTAKITASFDGNDDFKADSDYYMLTVVDPNKRYSEFDFASLSSVGGNPSSASSSPITIEFAKGKNTNTPPAYNNNSHDLRVYGGNTMTFKAAEGYYIQSIVVTTTTSSNTNKEFISGYSFTVNEESVGTCTYAEADNTYTWATDDATMSDVVVFNQGGTRGHTRIGKIVVNYAETAEETRAEAGLSFPEAAYTALLGKSFAAPELTKATTATAAYTSSNEEVATVDAATGVVTLVGEGTTTISATTEANEDFQKGSAEYVLTVVDPNAPIEIYASALGDDFEFIGQTVTGNTSYPWQHDATYGLKGSAYISEIKVCDAIAASPVIDLTNYTNIKLNFENAFNQYKVNNILINVADFAGKYAFIVVKEEGTDEWVELCEPTAPTAFNWNYFANDAIDLTEYAGKKVQFGFRYVSTAQCAGTWEVKNITVSAKLVPPTEATHDAPADEEGIVDLEQGSKDVTITVPDNHELWVKHTILTEEEEPIALFAETNEDEDGFTKVELTGNTHTIHVDKNSTLQYYTKFNGQKSGLTTLNFVNGNTTSINEIGVAEGEAEWFDLQGRRVVAPVKGIYVKRRGNTAVKVRF